MDLASEVIRGAGNLAKELRGADTKENRRWVYHKHERGQLPTWTEGGQIISTRTALRDHYRPRQARQPQETQTKNEIA
jgi:hypothetical protein